MGLPRVPLLQIVAECSPLARIAVTGSGLVALLNSVRTIRGNGFALWDAVSFLGLGSEPSEIVAQEMSRRIHAAYSASWSDEAKQVISPAAVVAELSPGKHNQLTSPRPALIAYTLG